MLLALHHDDDEDQEDDDDDDDDDEVELMTLKISAADQERNNFVIKRTC